MSNYVLQIHGRDLDINVSSRSVLGDRHTGYDLIEYGDDGSIIKIQTLDLIKNNSNGKIEILLQKVLINNRSFFRWKSANMAQ